MSIIDEIIKMNEELKNMNLSSDKMLTVLQKETEKIASGHNTTVDEIMRIYNIWKSKKLQNNYKSYLPDRKNGVT